MKTRVLKFFSVGFAMATLLTNQILRAEPSQGLLAHYPLNGDGADASGNGHTGAIAQVTPTADRFWSEPKGIVF